MSPAAVGGLLGAVVTLVLTGICYALAQLEIVSFLPQDVADAIIQLTPGDVATRGIEAVGAAAKSSIELSGLLLVVATGAATGALLAQHRAYTSLSNTLLLAAGGLMVIVGVQAAGGGFHDVVELGALALLLFGWSGTLLVMLRRALPPAPRVGDRPVPLVLRREFLLRSGGVLLTVAFGGALAGEGVRRQRADELAAAIARGDGWSLPGAPIDNGLAEPVVAVSPRGGMRPLITPVEHLYTVYSTARAARVRPNEWRLTVGGPVDQPAELSYADLRALPRVNQLSTLECISNAVGGNLIGTLVWTGTPLRDVLLRAGVSRDASHVQVRSVDGYTATLPLDVALDPHTLIAYAMNGENLSAEHGFPARLVVPGHYGFKHVKWLADISVIDTGARGFWEQRGWSEAAVVKTQSTIDTSNVELGNPSRVQLEAGGVEVAGYAYAGSREISGVEVQIDGGEWRGAELDPRHSPLAWRGWHMTWPATAGRHVIVVRATDGTGMLQTPDTAAPHPDGASGWHTVRLEVVA